MKTIVVQEEFDIPAEKIWEVVAEGFGQISNWHPEIIDSKIISDNTATQTGLERFCDYSMNGKRWAKERLEDYNPEAMTYTLKLLEAKDIPMDPDKCSAIYRVEDLGNNRSKLPIENNVETKPAMLLTFFLPFLKSAMGDIFLGIRHFATTGEPVTSYTIKAIKKKNAGKK